MGSLTFTTPPITKGDVWIALLSHNAVDTVSAPPAGWTFVTSLGSGADLLELYAHTVDGSELTSIVFTLATNIDEWQGEIIILEGTSPGTAVEATASATFTATTSLTTAGVTSQQAINLIFVAWTCSGSPTLTLPTGFTAVDSFSTAIVTTRSMLVGYKIAGATDALTFSAATASANTTGRSFTLVIRDRVPIAPVALVDLVPGNIGLIGKDTRQAR